MACHLRVLLRNALHVPDMAFTVVSLGRIMRAGYLIELDDPFLNIKRKPSLVVIGRIPVSSNYLFKVENSLSAATSEEAEDLLTLHRRLGHVAPSTIRTLIRTNAITGVQLVDDPSIPFVCDSCEYAKTTRKPIRKERQEPLAEAFGDEIHTDVWGPAPVQSLGGRKYYVTFTDDATRWTQLENLRTKDKAFEAYKALVAWAQTQKGVHIKRLRSDRGGEFKSNKFTEFLQEQGTERRLTTANTPQHNGVAESLNRRLAERTRAMRHQAKMPKNLWAEAMKHAVWLKNRTSTRVLGNVTPYEKLRGEKPNFKDVPEWGQTVWVHAKKRSKLDARGIQGCWVGYDADSTHAHRIYWPEQGKISVERDVKFPARVKPTPPSHTTITVPPSVPLGATAPPPAPIPAQAPPPLIPAVQTPPSPASIPLPPSPLTPLSSESEKDEEEGEEEDEVEQELVPPDTPAQKRKKQKTAQALHPTRKSTRITKPSYRLRRIAAGEGTSGSVEMDTVQCVFNAEFDDLIAGAIQDIETDPKTYLEARSRPDWPLWKAAMATEKRAFETHWNTSVSGRIRRKCVTVVWLTVCQCPRYGTEWMAGLKRAHAHQRPHLPSLNGSHILLNM
jgi:hypothetical protein